MEGGILPKTTMLWVTELACVKVMWVVAVAEREWGDNEIKKLAGHNPRNLEVVQGK